MNPPARHASVHQRPWFARVARWAALCIVAIAVELLVIHITRVGGVATTGDEPWYLIQSQALWNLHPPILAAATENFRNLTFPGFPPGTTFPSPLVEGLMGPHGWVGAFEPGLPLILAPFFNLGDVLISRTALMSIEVVGLVLLHRRVSLLTGLQRRSQWVLALFFAAPAVLVALTQIYPDFISGVVLACAAIELAIIEKTRSLTTFSTIVVGVAVAILPWLQIKNVAPGSILLLALLVVAWRCRASWQYPILVVLGVAVAWLVLLIYNLHYYGHPLGFPEPPSQVNRQAVGLTLGLLVGRGQGLFVQLPTALVGLTGLWLALRRLPIAVVASLATLGAILILNGTFTADPFGGDTLTGRFVWTMMPLLVAWSAWTISQWQLANRSMKAPAIIVGALWILQAIPILWKTHTYYNAYGQWDSSASSGWWGPVGRILPSFNVIGRPFGSPSVGLPLAVGLCVLIFVLAFRYCRPDSFAHWPTLAGFGVAGATLIALLIAIPQELPAGPLSLPDGTLGVTGSDGVLLQRVEPGTFQTTLVYSLSPHHASGVFTIWCQNDTGLHTATGHHAVSSGNGSSPVVVHCPQAGYLGASLILRPGSQVVQHSLKIVELTK